MKYLGWFRHPFISFSFLSKYPGNSSISLYLDIPSDKWFFFNVVSATYLSASLHSSNPIVSLSPSIFSRSSIALTKNTNCPISLGSNSLSWLQLLHKHVSLYDTSINQYRNLYLQELFIYIPYLLRWNQDLILVKT